MFEERKIAVVIPALNEERAIARVLKDIPDWADDVVVVDNGSTEATVEIAKGSGARVVCADARGYGTVCLAGMAFVNDPDIIVFLDADHSDHAEQMDRLVLPIAKDAADLVIGSRVLGHADRGALTPLQRYGNALACRLMRLHWRTNYTDLGPFRAISYRALCSLQMDDPNYGWTIQMQIRAARRGLRTMEVAVDYRRRVGVSKISGTVCGVVAAGTKIISTIYFEKAKPVWGTGLKVEGDHLIVFTRFPEPGKTKTRMIAVFGERGAADLQRDMTLHALSSVSELLQKREMTVELHYAGGSETRMREVFGTEWTCVAQTDGDLGERMRRAINRAFCRGAGSVVVMGTDCPQITADVLGRAFEATKKVDVVFNPATDGGYVLVGMRRPVPEIFEGIDWGAEAVLRESLDAAERAGLKVKLLDRLNDVDVAADLPVWRRADEARRNDPLEPRISVIVPAINESNHIEGTLSRAATGRGVELIVVDGGSTDETCAKAEGMGARVVHSDRGRALQMNAGAAVASGDVLLFLHADTLLPPGYDRAVRKAMQQSDAVAGAFRLGIDAPQRSLRFIERVVDFRSRVLKLPYGDQALFVGRGVFEETGGYPSQPIMEDYAFVRSLRRRGRIVMVDLPVRTSARRWLVNGVWRTTLCNQIYIFAYKLGVDAARIESWRSTQKPPSVEVPCDEDVASARS
ncbi:MAG: TIGR04283 family arsenosugar biosynthesis glycosyltransferase [Planctomycetes bacterium]|nr:TIGR04283 family arsenosugar biosynthesis glycosyltransferase [Planctomycetota bacterium]